jgi:hypothetical protein
VDAVGAGAGLRALINARNAAGNTALHWAALNGHLACVQVLVDNGADPTATNEAGHDAVYEAELAGRSEVVEWVLREGGEALEAGFGAQADAVDEVVEADEMGDQTADPAAGQTVAEKLEALGLDASQAR